MNTINGVGIPGCLMLMKLVRRYKKRVFSYTIQINDS